MSKGKTLTQLATEIERQRDSKKDYIADTRALLMDSNNIVLGGDHYPLTNHAKRQLAEKLDIPFPYYERLEAKHPALLAENVNTFFQKEPQRNMIRTLDGNVRGVMSDRYRPLDNYDMLDALLPVVQQSKAELVSCDVTEQKMYIKLRMPWLDRELPMPEGLKMGVGHNFFVRKIEGSVVISNSEVGSGRISIAPAVFEKQCTNLAVFKDEGFNKLHVGGRAGGEDLVSQYLSDETKKIKDAAVWAEVRDVMAAVLNGSVMNSIVAKLTAARGDAITGDPTKLVEVFSKKNGLTEGERGGLLKHLVESGEMTRYGLQWAVTRLAQDVESYDRASEFERMGGAVIELARNDWQVLAKAA